MSDSGAGSRAAEEPPPLAIVVYENGRASVGGIPVTVTDATDPSAVRGAAIRTAVGMAADRGGPLRALAFEPDGSVWPLVVHPNGLVEEDAEAEEPPPDTSGGTSGSPPGGPSGRGAATLSLRATPSSSRGPRTETIVLNPGWSDIVQTPQPPDRFRDRLVRIAEAGNAGRIEAAMSLTVDLEREVALLFGSSHPHVLQARAVRAHISTLAHDWSRAADLYLDLAAAWLDASGGRSAQLLLNAGNAHYCWRLVADPEDSERIGEAVVRMWLKVPGAARQLDAARRHRDGLRRRASLAPRGAGA